MDELFTIQQQILDHIQTEGFTNKTFIRRAVAYTLEVNVTYSMIEPHLDILEEKGLIEANHAAPTTTYKPTTSITA